jgi:hypothetical protein
MFEFFFFFFYFLHTWIFKMVLKIQPENPLRVIKQAWYYLQKATNDSERNVIRKPPAVTCTALMAYFSNEVMETEKKRSKGIIRKDTQNKWLIL